MMHFDSVLDRPVTAQPPAPAPEPTVAVVETVTVTQHPSESRGYMLKDDTEWEWGDLRDYVITQIEERFGPQPRDFKKEYGIFSRFLKTYQEFAPVIARYAFDIENGWWMSAPIRVTRFTRGCDPYFAEVILSRLSA